MRDAAELAVQQCARVAMEGLENRLLFVAPTATLVNAPATNPPASAYTFGVRYNDTDGTINVATINGSLVTGFSDILVTGPAGISQPATLSGTTGTGATVTATYSVTAPPLAGVYTINMEPLEVSDNAGEVVPGGVLGTFTQLTTPGGGGGGGTGDTTPPTAILSGNMVNAAGLGYDLDVTYTDETDIATATISNDDIRVTGPSGFDQLGKFQGVDDVGMGLRIGHYRIPSPLVMGTYTVAMEGMQVADTGSNFVAAGTIGSFMAGIVPPSGGTTTPPTNFGNPDPAAVPTNVPDQVAVGGKGKATIRVSNLGDPSTRTKVTVRVFISNDNALSTDDLLLKEFTTKRIKGGESRAQEISYIVPNVPAGDYFYIAQADPENLIAEVNEGNNTNPSNETVNVTVPFVDLTADVRGNLPDSVVAGDKGQLTVRVGNKGTGAFNRRATIQLFASTDTVLDSSDRALVTIERNLNLKAINGRTDVPVPFTYPVDLQDGTYRIIARVDAGTQIADPNLSNNLDTTDDTVLVKRAFIDLRALSLSGNGGVVSRGQDNFFDLKIDNKGNVPARGPLSIQLSARSPSLVGDVPLMRSVVNLNIGPDQVRVFHLRLPIPTTLPSGSTFFVAAIDVDQVFTESIETNNTVTTVNPYPVP